MKDSASFRDPAGFILKDHGKIFRVIRDNYKLNFDFLLDSGLYKKLLHDNLIIEHKEVVSKTYVDDQYKLLEVKNIKYITYPYEWSFSQYKDAALLTLNIQRHCVDFGMKLKDATPYNIQFINNKPIFIDSLSFEKVEDNYAWEAYRQFCEMFLGPLYLMSKIDPKLSELLVTNINGLNLNFINKFLGFKDYFNLSALTHLIIPNIIAKKGEQKNVTQKNVKISKTQHLNILNQLINFIENLKIKNFKTTWSDYNISTLEQRGSYYKDKKNTIFSFLNQKKYSLIWDIGANNGVFSREFFSKVSKDVISLDIDWSCVEENYLINKKNNTNNVFPLVLDLSNPSPSIGWNNEERPSIYKRIGSPDLISCLALIHHVIKENIPLEYFLNFLYECSLNFVLIEYVPLSDPKCQEIFKSTIHNLNYPTKEEFEKLLNKNFIINKMKILNETERVLYFVEKK